MTCRRCNTKMPSSWRGTTLGRNWFCGDKCKTAFALVEVPRLEAHLSKISAKARGIGRYLAMQALYSNGDPT